MALSLFASTRALKRRKLDRKRVPTLAANAAFVTLVAGSQITAPSPISLSINSSTKVSTTFSAAATINLPVFYPLVDTSLLIMRKASSRDSPSEKSRYLCKRILFGGRPSKTVLGSSCSRSADGKRT
ncbi:hypothetical protein B0H66DRAFT_609727 [Apodospora peruviana]|uniref:Uncharacterized protein n=1 Tax=Apodospora peruviana TaxID=516989 RepID=A0AAE0IQG7_9PEZI|nr:hypothetical protein B0H66DRAFT_609727 [Apodospora peruviana]